MTTFDDREKAEENRFAHDEEVLFKARARRNHLVGLWAAGKLGLEGGGAENYALALVSLGPDQKVVDKLKADLASHGVSDHQIHRELDQTMPIALDHVKRA